MKNKTNQFIAGSLLMLFSWLNLSAMAQDQGIHFEHGLSWSAIKEKAKKENKYIFVDCFTTWCGPCKMMSQQIFPQQKVGEYFNQHFVSVKAQMDKTDKDKEEVKDWYADAAFLAKEYNVLAYPTFLYFSPEGKLVHLFVGSTKEAEEFIKVSGEALDPSTQYFTKMEASVKEAENGSPEKLRDMALEAKKRYDGVNTARLAQAYLKQMKNVFTKENLEFLDQFTSHSSDAGFKYFTEQPDKVNAIMGKGFAQRKIAMVAFQEAGANEWLMSKSENGRGEVEQKIRQQFPKMAGLLIQKLTITSLQYGGKKEDFAKAVVPFVKKNNKIIPPQDLSSYARSLGRSENKEQLKTALGWAEQAWKEEPSEGTAFVYATLLYRSGAKDDAIAMQKKVLEMGEANEKRTPNKYYQGILEKMEKGEQL